MNLRKTIVSSNRFVGAVLPAAFVFAQQSINSGCSVNGFCGTVSTPVSSAVERQTENLNVTGSNPVPSSRIGDYAETMRCLMGVSTAKPEGGRRLKSDFSINDRSIR